MNTRQKKFSIKEVVSDNVKRLMAHHVDLNTLDKVSKRSGVPRETVNRIKNGTHNCRIDNIDALAGAFGLRAWHLMIPNLDPSNPPVYLSEREQQLYARMASAARDLPQTPVPAGFGPSMALKRK